MQTKDLEHQNQYGFHGITAAELGLDKKLSFKFDNIDAEINLQPSAIGIRADFMVSYSAEFSCMRCLAIYKRDCEVDLHLEYVEGDDPHMKSENVEITAHDADRVHYRGPQIDLSIGIREAIILSQPITRLCRDDCPGLCPVCGKDLNARKCTCKVEKVGVFTPQVNTQKKHRVKKNRRTSKD